MLVLSRKKGEAIHIADDVTITIVEIRGGRVRLSIDAPRSVRVIRNELLDADLLQENQRTLQLVSAPD